MEDKEMISKIREGDHRQTLVVLYKEFPSFKKRVLKDGGSKEVAQEVFQDALLVVLEKANQPSFQLKSALTTYLQGVGWLLWKNKKKVDYRAESRKRDYQSNWELQDFEFDEERENRLSKVDEVLRQMDEKCRKLFRLFYFEKLKMKEVAEKMGYTSVGSAKTRKYKCMEQAMNLAKAMRTSSKN